MVFPHQVIIDFITLHLSIVGVLTLNLCSAFHRIYHAACIWVLLAPLTNTQHPPTSLPGTPRCGDRSKTGSGEESLKTKNNKPPCLSLVLLILQSPNVLLAT